MKTTRICVLGTVIGLVACNGGDSGSNQQEFDTFGLLSNVVDEMVIPSYDRFSERVDELTGEEGSLQQYCDAIGTSSEQSQLEQAQNDWTDAMAEWQQSELWLIGAASENSFNLRNRINAFGEANFVPCFVDQAVIERNNDASFSVGSRSANHVGLPALEYLLFNENLNHQCDSTLSISLDWNGLPDEERKQQRCELAKAVAEDVDTTITLIRERWSPEVGNDRLDFLNPQNTAASLQALSDGLFYLDTRVQDTKIGVPAGIANSECQSDEIDFSRVESPYSENSYENIENNLKGFLQLYLGGDGLGFDDIIIEAGQQAFHEELQQKIQAAIDYVESTENTLAADLDAIDPANTRCTDSLNASGVIEGIPSPYNLYTLLRQINNDLSTRFLVITALDIPDRAQSDND